MKSEMDGLAKVNSRAVFGKTLTYAKAKIIICLPKNSNSANKYKYNQTVFVDTSGFCKATITRFPLYYPNGYPNCEQDISSFLDTHIGPQYAGDLMSFVHDNPSDPASSAPSDWNAVVTYIQVIIQVME